MCRNLVATIFVMMLSAGAAHAQCAALTMTPPVGYLPKGHVGKPYAASVSASGGSGIYYWQLTAASGGLSCPTIGQTCSFSSGGVTRHCTCSRTDGEGQFPSWICD